MITDGKALQRYTFVDRAEARLPDFFLPKAKGVIIAEPEFMRAIELPVWLEYPVGWSLLDYNRGKSTEGKLEVAKLGEYWFIGRRDSEYDEVKETIVEVFGKALICARTPCEAMLIAEYCHPEVRLPIGAGWVKFK